jgi:hypothetical protein
MEREIMDSKSHNNLRAWDGPISWDIMNTIWRQEMSIYHRKGPRYSLTEQGMNVGADQMMHYSRTAKLERSHLKIYVNNEFMDNTLTILY